MDHAVATRAIAPRAGLAEAIETSAAAAEARGLSAWWTVGDRDAAHGSWDPYLVLQAAARSTSRLRLASAGDLLDVRSPGVRAKQVASLDWFAGGRLEYAVDVAGTPDALRDPFLDGSTADATSDTAAADLDATREHLAAMTTLWTQDRAVHAGQRLSFEGAIAKPKPRGGQVPPVHARVDTAAQANAWLATGSPVDGLLLWLLDGDAVAALLAEADLAPGTRITWFVEATDVEDVRARALELGVTELVAVHDHLPTDADLDRLVAVEN